MAEKEPIVEVILLSSDDEESEPSRSSAKCFKRSDSGAANGESCRQARADTSSPEKRKEKVSRSRMKREPDPLGDTQAEESTASRRRMKAVRKMAITSSICPDSVPLEGRNPVVVLEKMRVFKPWKAIKESEIEVRAAHLLAPGDDYFEEDKQPMKMTDFQIYDKLGDFVSFDDSSLNMDGIGKRFFICGVIVGVFDASAEPVKVVDVELFGSPWLCGFGEDNLTIGVSSSKYDIYLLEPHEIYKNIYQRHQRQCQIAKRVADFLIEKQDADAEWEELVDYLEDSTTWCSSISEDELIANASFAFNHISSYDDGRDDDEPSILEQPCVDQLMKLSGAEVAAKAGGKAKRNRRKKAEKVQTTKAVATPLVAKAFSVSDMSEYFEVCDIPGGAKTTVSANISCNSRGVIVGDIGSRKSSSEEETTETKLISNTLEYRGQLYRPGDGVYMASGTFKFKYSKPSNRGSLKKVVNNPDYEYPEQYRKNKDDGGAAAPKPFCVGRIVEFLESKNAEILVRVRQFYRPEDTSSSKTVAKSMDWNLVYFSDEIVDFPVSAIDGQCAVLSEGCITAKEQKLADYFSGGKNRFYFAKKFDAKSEKFIRQIPNCEDEAAARARVDEILRSTAYPKIKDSSRLQALDIFAGCGGLTEGLRQSGILSETCWAIERDGAAARSFELNHPKAKVFTEDCNILLKRKLADPRNSELPDPDEVDLIVGGPPCQGFSRLNRNKGDENSQLQCSLMLTSMSYIDYYRPRFVILENVAMFKTHGKGYIYKGCVDCFKKMGYNVNCEVLEAGTFGVPQTRRRTIMIAALSDERLPAFPTATHSFWGRSVSSAVSAPFRAMTVEDGIRDLVELSNKEFDTYAQDCTSAHFQRLMRGSSEKLLDHCVKTINVLSQERINHIPPVPGADWRDLPNRAYEKSGTSIEKLRYIDGTNDVCACMAKKRYEKPRAGQKGRSHDRKKKASCSRQEGTLIPWCLVHTGEWNNQWAGLYGRLDYNGFFKTTVTNPSPLGQQGQVLHPEKNRIYSVREAARSQGFPDGYVFSGDLSQKYRQIGNAVPPPLAAALGRELLVCLAEKEN